MKGDTVKEEKLKESQCSSITAAPWWRQQAVIDTVAAVGVH